MGSSAVGGGLFLTGSDSSSRKPRVISRLLPVLGALLVASAPLWAQVEPLGHPSVEDRIEALGTDPSQGFRFVAFGDQKNLWNNEFPRLLDLVRAEASKGDLLFMLDSGDFVDDGTKTDQFDTLRRHLAPVADVPYLVGVGNHELQPEKGPEGRRRAHRHTVEFLGGEYAEGRMFYAKRVGPVRLLFLNTNDLPGVYPKMYKSDPGVGARAAAQLKWLDEELREDVHPTIAISHHAFVQSPSKHRGHARALWNYTYRDYGDRTLPEILIDGGVDLILTGHVHSYEVFKLERGGRQMWSVNASGKPTGIWRSGQRMPSNWQGRELEQLKEKGFDTRLEQWTIRQLDFMTNETKQNQLAVMTVDAVGSLQIEIRSVDGTTLHALQIPGITP